MDPITLLDELRESWNIAITNEPAGHWRLSLERDGSAHVYRGNDLGLLVRVAHAGSPSGRY